MHVGVIDFGGSTWTGGSNFSKLIARVLGGADGIKCSLLSDAREKPQLEGVNFVPLRNYYRQPGRIEGFLRSNMGLATASPIERAIEAEKIDVVLPAVDLGIKPLCATIGWIPDFQHLTAPQFFSVEEIAIRSERCGQVASRADKVLFSSEDAAEPFRRLFPEEASKARVISFPSTLALDPLPGLIDVRARFQLPDRFAIVPNQFWRHKNHLTVLKALKILKSKGQVVHCVFTGLLHDSRDPGNTYLSEVLQEISKCDVRDCVSLLGFVSREELISLLRTAAVVLQPSYSEGWSTSVQDARALGRPVICSDIPVLREQAPDAAGFFRPDDARALAQCMEDSWHSLSSRSVEEAECINKEKQAIGEYRNALLELCRVAKQEHR